MKAAVDQVSLWDESVSLDIPKEDKILTEEEFQKGAKGEGGWVRVYYVDDYTPTPGLITARDCYNAWCVSRQAQAKMLREFYCYHLEADQIERNLWRWTGLGPDTKKQFERMAEHLMKTVVLPQKEQ